MYIRKVDLTTSLKPTTTTPFDAEAHVDHMATVMDLPVDPSWRPTVVATLVATARIAALVNAFPLDDHIEPAPVFEP
jgi:1-carboxybiuret hydrolase subunit AtzG-like